MFAGLMFAGLMFAGLMSGWPALLSAADGSSTQPGASAASRPSQAKPARKSVPRGAPGHRSFDADLRGPGALVVRNRTDHPIRLRWAADIERLSDETWTVERAHLFLFGACPEPDAPPTGCVTVPARGTVRVQPWTGYFGCAQCDVCRKNVPAAPGTYRFVVWSCDGRTRVESPLSILNEPGKISGPPWAD
ncbi:MAG: hypothetical protein IPK13_17095 [Deltaproteobacteria bacterium]|nr:hypothetical protein [Deltaproteobacteria bacterium]